MAFDTAGNILLKQGMNGFSESTLAGWRKHWANIKLVLGSNILMLGALCMVCEAIVWFGFLSITPLNVAGPMASANNVFILLASSWLLKERVTPKRWLGVALIISGMLFVGSA
ncbi:MAG: EamA family transporter [Bdellovibrio sp.]|nr:EamA family transporter [Methylotenera sp.]